MAEPAIVGRVVSGMAVLDAIAEADAARALCLWTNVPGNPTGEVAESQRIRATSDGHRHPERQHHPVRAAPLERLTGPWGA